MSIVVTVSHLLGKLLLLKGNKKAIRSTVICSAGSIDKPNVYEELLLKLLKISTGLVS